jgi:response regulator RpfG family c-di-GMP phosphodiesterase
MGTANQFRCTASVCSTLNGSPLPARVFSVIDAFDAITSDRVYRRGAPYEEALRRITAASGTQFDPRVVAAFTLIPPVDWEMIRIVCATESDPQLT